MSKRGEGERQRRMEVDERMGAIPGTTARCSRLQVGGTAAKGDTHTGNYTRKPKLRKAENGKQKADSHSQRL